MTRAGEANDPEARGLGALMESYVDGDERAFAALHAALAPRLRRQIGAKVSDGATAEDLVQTVFMRAHRARHRFEVPEGGDRDRGVAVWYATIARNAIYDHLRRVYRGRVAPLGGTTEAASDRIEGHPDAAPDVEARMVAREGASATADAVHRAIERLPTNQREVVTLHRLEGLGMGEIARRLGVREGTLRVRAHRGYRALEALLLPFKDSFARA